MTPELATILWITKSCHEPYERLTFDNQILPWVCLKRGVGYLKVPAAGTSQECPQYGARRKKILSDRWHRCECGYSLPRDVASGMVIRQRAVEARVALRC
ncbi:MAG: zinc ribbon domain-containing protein [Phormidesmis sp.]